MPKSLILLEIATDMLRYDTIRLAKERSFSRHIHIFLQQEWRYSYWAVVIVRINVSINCKTNCSRFLVYAPTFRNLFKLLLKLKIRIMTTLCKWNTLISWYTDSLFANLFAFRMKMATNVPSVFIYYGFHILLLLARRSIVLP